MKPELMDEPQPVTRELRHTLRELEFLNRHLGGHRYVRRFLRQQFTLTEKRYRILDLCTGGGDFPRMIVDWARKSGRRVQVDAVDAGASIVELAESFSVRYPEIRYRHGNALAYDNGHRFDLVHCSLSLHHFERDNAMQLLRQMRKLSCSWVLLTDLVQGWFTTAGVGLLTRLLGYERMAIEDGDTSARRAYTFDQVDALARGAGWRGYRHERFPICRQALLLKV